MTITEQTTVAEIASALPTSIRVFERHGIDFCCGGKRALGAVCRERGVRFEDVAAAIEASAAASSTDQRDWTGAALHTLIDHIVTTYHDTLREELPRLESMAVKVVGVHGAKAPQLSRIESIVHELSSDLLAHMHKEERVLFPAIRAIENGDEGLPIPLSAPIAVMEHEHDQAGALLFELRTITDDFRAPLWACATLRGLYSGLAELESAMHVHVHLENNVLFPRALDLARTGGAVRT